MSTDEPLRISVDGEEFAVSQPDDSPGTYHFTWLTGPDPAYGFMSASHPPTQATRPDLEEAARDFLAQVDPTTGYIE
ncbi:hypothetical protein O1Q96_27400 [Streptomyces sp. Qhu-G9]|uniref:hypothetical protein n=1 Tax=Streptomyces sp. Qhu-G9 TaxID=3452799 RepID=UPI0022ABEF4D|nr:hypothetical protein [Streptomyces aurantiacus]WAU83087.1 hypothetical protein O1Q96_27400 [Streptomyces aurantiacus]